jgi:hypothetical protein
MWLGHHSPAFTLATYVHLLPDDLPDPEFLDALTRIASVSNSTVEGDQRLVVEAAVAVGDVVP